MMLLNYVLLIVTAVVELAAGKRDPSGKISNGFEAYIEDFPHQVFLKLSFADDSLFCGGSIITWRHILTAAHCLLTKNNTEIMPPEEIAVVAGQTFQKITRETISRNVSKFVIHEDYDPNVNENGLPHVNDIGILFLKEPLPTDREGIKRIGVSPPKPKIECFVSGWGRLIYDENAPSHYRLMAAEVYIVSKSECQKQYLNALTTGMTCAWNRETRGNQCKGDSGGPLTCNGRLTGIVSMAIECGRSGYPGIYTSVSHYLPWIRSVLHRKNRNVQEPRRFTKDFSWTRSTQLGQKKVDVKVVTKPDIDLSEISADVRIRSKKMILFLLVLSITFKLLFV